MKSSSNTESTRKLVKSASWTKMLKLHDFFLELSLKQWPSSSNDEVNSILWIASNYKLLRVKKYQVKTIVQFKKVPISLRLWKKY